MVASTRAPADAPGAGTLRWVERQLGHDRVLGARRLTGGVATATHLLQLASGRRVILRRHNARWIEWDPTVVAREAETLAHVAGRGLPVPELLACDPDGSSTGERPAVVLGRLPGAIELAPADPGSWLDQMASALATIHDVPPAPASTPPAEHPWSTRSWKPPAWSTHPDLWAEAIARCAEAPPGYGVPPPQLVHGDFQHFNLLWSRGRLTGIVDWGAPPARPLDSDLGHCRLNLVILFGTEVADDFLRRYESLTGRGIDPAWDLVETVIFLPTWAPTILRQVGARIPVSAAAIHRRVDAHLPALLRRFG
jgi:aminoglycoside phosphotransferase (APT) family kinase protein